MTTGIIDPNDPSNFIFPREHMPAFRYRTEDVRYKEFMEGVVSDLTMEFLKMLPTLPPDDDEGIIEGDAANVHDKRESPEESKGSINIIFHRILQLLAMDYKSMVLCLRRDGLSTRSSQSVANMVTSVRNKAMEAFLKSVAATLHNKRIPPPASDRMSMVTYCITDSPILFRAVELIRENKKVGKRTLVLVFSQVMQQWMVAILEKASFSALGVRGYQIDNERNAIYAKFNDPDADIDALVLNMAVSTVGLNLQGACTEGIILIEG
ncbi:hypothetical protein B0T26DRAFT_240419 [Lasiosphaeria miniovina]|uniref:Helicase C-terminal domain-containing protein n=1 Tax=Lasiosphaeria miniovina TaxID=1954250 RepID=A0AA40E2U8_9PEZI|nr:uncharacterized protein B0T26DRAFT_240419 [Lasiosphaeria miniovina]KAK0722917.1 hypothetical protein B0T26DRAFT_240419 [Lasiosphaeria miniovina]